MVKSEQTLAIHIFELISIMATEYTKQEQDYLVKVGNRLRELRKQQTGLSQEDFARTCGLDRTYISDIERGTRNISLLNLRKIAKALKIQPAELLSI
jgi:DNA-binding XRE family transcriptional regulator